MACWNILGISRLYTWKLIRGGLYGKYTKSGLSFRKNAIRVSRYVEEEDSKNMK